MEAASNIVGEFARIKLFGSRRTMSEPKYEVFIILLVCVMLDFPFLLIIGRDEVFVSLSINFPRNNRLLDRGL